MTNSPMFEGLHATDCFVTDEKLFMVQVVHNPQNDLILCSNIKKAPTEKYTLFKHQKLALMMVWAGVTSRVQKIPFFFIDQGVEMH